MEYRVLETRSADILTKYYNNEINSFLNACHEDILWIGPAEKHVIRTRKALVDAFSQEEHELEFVLSDLKVFSIGLTECSCEVIMFFILDTIWPDSSVGRADQRMQFTWVSENGVEKIKLCHISNAIKYDERDRIYPVHYEEIYKKNVCSGERRTKRVIVNGVDRSLVFLDRSWIAYVESSGSHCVIYTIDGSFESVQSLKVFERRYMDMFVRCHENYLVNPEYVSRISRYRIELTYGKVIPISEKNYTAVKTKLSHITQKLVNILRVRQFFNQHIFSKFRRMDFIIRFSSLDM